MSLESVLFMLQERKLEVYVDEAGKARLRGPAKAITSELREALTTYRDAIIELFRPKPLRRIVLLLGDFDSEIQTVLEEGPAEGLQGRVRHWSRQFPERTIAAEWWQKDRKGERYTRFLWMTWPAEKIDEDSPAEDVASAGDSRLRLPG